VGQIVVEIEAEKPIRVRDLRLDLSIVHPAGGQFVALSTDLDGADRIAGETILGSKALVCELDGLPLRPGTYTVGASLAWRGKLVQQIDRATDLQLIAGPFFDSGGVPASYPAAVLVRHNWSLDDVEAPPEPESISGIAQTPAR
jgi:hypothetical protein